MNQHVNPLFREALNSVIPLRECYVCSSKFHTFTPGERVFCCDACENEYAGICDSDRYAAHSYDEEGDE